MSSEVVRENPQGGSRGKLKEGIESFMGWLREENKRIRIVIRVCPDDEAGGKMKIQRK